MPIHSSRERLSPWKGTSKSKRPRNRAHLCWDRLERRAPVPETMQSADADTCSNRISTMNVRCATSIWLRHSPRVPVAASLLARLAAARVVDPARQQPAATRLEITEYAFYGPHLTARPIFTQVWGASPRRVDVMVAVSEHPMRPRGGPDKLE